MPHDHHDHEHDHSHEGLSPSGHPYRADNDTDLSYWQDDGDCPARIAY